MKKKKILFIIGLLLIVVILSFTTFKGNGQSNDQILDGVVVLPERMYVDNTSNLFSIIGNKISNLIITGVSYIFILINKLFELIFGV